MIVAGISPGIHVLPPGWWAGLTNVITGTRLPTRPPKSIDARGVFGVGVVVTSEEVAPLVEGSPCGFLSECAKSLRREPSGSQRDTASVKTRLRFFPSLFVLL